MSILKGKNVDLQLVEKEDYPQSLEWSQDWDFVGPFWPAIRHRTRHEAEKEFLEPKNPGLELTRYFVVRKDGKKIGLVSHFWGSQIYNWMEIGYAMSPLERGKGYTTQAAQILVYFLPPTRQLPRVQACVDVENVGSQKVVEKTGFAREGACSGMLTGPVGCGGTCTSTASSGTNGKLHGSSGSSNGLSGMGLGRGRKV